MLFISDILVQTCTPTNGAPSYDTRQALLIPTVPQLGKEVALKAIKECGQPVSKITHLVCSTATGIEMHGCYSGAAAIRSAKELAENNSRARVLVVSSELLSTMFFQGPMETKLNHLFGNVIFGDGASTVIIGAYPDLTIERPLFQLESATCIEASMKDAFRDIDISDWNSLFLIVHPGGPTILNKVNQKL
ncbi:hypothetical protein ACFE04_015924 [Oxalis oulophora]